MFLTLSPTTKSRYSEEYTAAMEDTLWFSTNE
jgi:hypothetical protein